MSIVMNSILMIAGRSSVHPGPDPGLQLRSPGDNRVIRMMNHKYTIMCPH